jgi:hypothetical protein
MQPKKIEKFHFRCIMLTTHFFTKVHRYFSFLDIFLDKNKCPFLKNFLTLFFFFLA